MANKNDALPINKTVVNPIAKEAWHRYQWQDFHRTPYEAFLAGFAARDKEVELLGRRIKELETQLKIK